MILAAGVLFLAGDDPRALKALLVRRTGVGDHEGEWSVPGGKIEEDETAEEAAIRECEEELGIVHFPNDLELHARRIRDGVDYTTFACRVPEPFEVTLNEEHDAFEWVPVGSVSGVEEERSDAEFKESEHPRDEDGKFGSGSGKAEPVKVKTPRNPPRDATVTTKVTGAGGKTIKVNRDTYGVPWGYYDKVTDAIDSGDEAKIDAMMTDFGTYAETRLSGRERSVLNEYKEQTYQEINDELIALKGDISKANPATKTLAKAIGESVVPADLPAFRGIDTTLKQLTGFDDPAEAVGKAFVHYNFVSTSRDPAVVSTFGGDQLTMAFTIPAGSKGLVVADTQKKGGERETILPANSAFRIDRVEGNIVHCTYLGTRS